MGEAENGWLFSSPESCLTCVTWLLLLEIGIGGNGDVLIPYVAIEQSYNTFVRCFPC